MGIESFIKSNSKGAINQVSFEVHTKVNFAHIVFGDDCIVSRIRRVVSCNIVQRASGGKGLSSFNSLFFTQISQCTFNVSTDVNEFSTGLNDTLSEFSDLSVDDSCSSQAENFLAQKIILLEVIFVFKSDSKFSFVSFNPTCGKVRVLWI